MMAAAWWRRWRWQWGRLVAVAAAALWQLDGGGSGGSFALAGWRWWRRRGNSSLEAVWWRWQGGGGGPSCHWRWRQRDRVMAMTAVQRDGRVPQEVELDPGILQAVHGHNVGVRHQHGLWPVVAGEVVPRVAREGTASPPAPAIQGDLVLALGPDVRGGARGPQACAGPGGDACSTGTWHSTCPQRPPARSP
jgi:hypothetical protein